MTPTPIPGAGYGGAGGWGNVLDSHSVFSNAVGGLYPNEFSGASPSGSKHY